MNLILQRSSSNKPEEEMHELFFIQDHWFLGAIDCDYVLSEPVYMASHSLGASFSQVH